MNQTSNYPTHVISGNHLQYRHPKVDLKLRWSHCHIFTQLLFCFRRKCRKSENCTFSFWDISATRWDIDLILGALESWDLGLSNAQSTESIACSGMILMAKMLAPLKNALSTAGAQKNSLRYRCWHRSQSYQKQWLVASKVSKTWTTFEATIPNTVFAKNRQFLYVLTQGSIWTKNSFAA